ncbi:MAG: protein tyrosine phosphatase [Microvirga sp.]
MPSLHICSLSRLHDTAASCRASHVVSLVTGGTPVTRPEAILPEHHLVLGLSDIVSPLDGHVLPATEHVEALLAFARSWPRERPVVIHCWAGISRSTAAAFIIACALAPNRSEAEIALSLRAASPSATPNPLLVSLADDLLGRDSRMANAVRAIGRGCEAMEGTPFMLGLNQA